MSASPALRSADPEVPDAPPEVEPPSKFAGRPELQASPTPTAAPAPMPAPRAAGYMLASLLLALTQGLGMNLISANLPQIQGAIGATATEATWLMAAYMAPNVSLSLALIKIRNQYGLRNFAELSILGFVIVASMHLFVDDLHSALVVRFLSGIVAAPMSTLCFLYMLEPFAPARKLTVGLSLALTSLSLGMPVARLISPGLLQIGLWHGLHVAEIALALMAFAAVYLLPLTPQPRAKVIELLDIVSFLLIATGFGLTAVVLTLGRLYWWFEAPWLGMMLAGGVASVTLAAVIELNRKSPLVDIRWLASPEVIHFTGALLIFRIILSEQTTGAVGFLQALGLTNDQTAVLYGITLASSIAGGLACAAVMKPGREQWIHVVALALLMGGAFMDSHATSLTRPEQMLLSQAMIAFAGSLFLPPALASGLMSALKRGPNYILSFVIIFLTTQSIGGLLGSATLGTYLTVRTKVHAASLVQRIVLTDPVVAQRVSQLEAAYGRVITDKAQLGTQGLNLLNQQVTRESNVLAYNDLFLLVAALAGLALAALLIHMAILALGRLVADPQPAN